MKAKWSKTWGSSVQPRKQRKYRANAPLHIKQKFVSAHLEKNLKEKMNKKRSLPLRKGDEVKVLRGKRKGIKAKISAIDLSKKRVYLEGQTRENIRGTKNPIPFEPSNLLITSLADDKRRNRQGKKIVKTKPKAKEKKEKPEAKSVVKKEKEVKEKPKVEKKPETKPTDKKPEQKETKKEIKK